MVNLHVHSCYSILDSNAKFEDLISRAKELGQTAIAQTDHAYIMEAPEFARQCEEADIKYLYGCEVYECDDRFIKDKDNKYFHLLLLATNEIGRVNLNKLITLADKEGFYYRSRCDWDLLEKYNEGLICLSACLGSRIDRKLAEETETSYDEAREIALKFKSIFGDRYYLEFQSHRDDLQIKINRLIVNLAKELDIPYVVTSDVHFVKEEDKFFHDEIFVKIAKDSDVGGEYYTDCFLQSEINIREFCRGYLTEEELNIAINNTDIISDRCNVQLPFSSVIVPDAKIPEWFIGDYGEYFKYLCQKGFEEKGLHKRNNRKEYADRMDYEIKVLHDLEYDKYLLYVLDKVNTITKYGELGDGRGSVSSSLCAWLIGITRVDPIKFGLIFSRFCDEDNLLIEDKTKRSASDVDIDANAKNRNQISNIICESDGKDKSVSVLALQYFWAKSSIKDIAKFMGIPFEVSNEITKTIESSELTDAVIENEIDKKYFDMYPKLFEYAKKMSGLPKNRSVHASGKITTVKETTWYAPVFNLDGVDVVQCTMASVDKLGLLKFDLLGLRTRDVIADARDLAGLPKNAMDPNVLNMQDEKVLDLFRRGKTDAIFQFERDFVKNILIRTKISSINDLSTITALARPGSMKEIQRFIDCKNDPSKIRYINDDLKSILEPYAGILIMQESTMKISEMANMKSKNKLMKSIKKKKKALMEECKEELVNNLLKKGWTLGEASELYNSIEAASSYQFCLAHAIAYAMTSYEAAWLKVYYPLEFWTAVLNSYEGKSEKIQSTLSSMSNDNIQFGFPDYKNLSSKCYIKDKKIYLGTNIVKSMSSKVGEDSVWIKDIDIRKDNVIDFLIYNENITENKITKGNLETLIKLGAFDCTKISRLDFLEILDSFHSGKNLKYDPKHTEKTKEKRKVALYEYVASKEIKTTPAGMILDWESEYFGVPVSTFNFIPNNYGYVIEREETKYTDSRGDKVVYIHIYGLNSGNKKKYKLGCLSPQIKTNDVIVLDKVLDKNRQGEPYKTPVISKLRKIEKRVRDATPVKIST